MRYLIDCPYLLSVSALLCATLTLSCSGGGDNSAPATAPRAETPPAELNTPAEPDDVALGKEYRLSDKTMLVGQMPVHAVWDLQTAFPGRSLIENIANAPLATQLCEGLVFNGVTGTAICRDLVHASHIFRNVEASPLRLIDESSSYAGQDLPAGYREVPDLNRDNDGGTLVSVIPANRVGFVDCGLIGTLPEREADCKTKNLNSVWSGRDKSLTGYNQWTLIVRRAAGIEVWRDDLTGLIWSSRVGKDNWCVAAGNAQSDDPHAICNQSAQQIDFPEAQSFCSEQNTIPHPATLENWEAALYSPGKGGMGKNSVPSLRWRLPTKNDYLLAEANGIRFVLPDMITSPSSTEWTATAYSAHRNYAWGFTNVTGAFNPSYLRTTKLHIRCVGR